MFWVMTVFSLWMRRDAYPIFLFAGIAAANYSHVQYFNDRVTYNEFYGIMLRVVGIAVLSFADTDQSFAG